MKTKLLIIVGLFYVVTTQAQEIKIGYIDLDVIFRGMPEMKVADSIAMAYEQELQATLSKKYEDYQVRLETYQKEGADLDTVIKQDAEKELQDLQSQIEQFRSSATQAIGQKKQSLLNPLRTKVKDAINEVAEQNDYTHVFATDGTLIYVKDEDANLSNKVAGQLGFKLQGKGE